MTDIVSIAARIESRALKLRGEFQAEANPIRAAHMAVLLSAVNRIRKAHGEGVRLAASDRAWTAIREIQQLGYPDEEDFEANEQRVVPVLALFTELHRSYAARDGAI